mmetsp:Transcript_58588/g.155997  ORF Transcript_58588/g.155997 Transcript_58588/m.155997 type:complete len:232 (+) Transcript_58588:866-1561(+)
MLPDSPVGCATRLPATRCATVPPRLPAPFHVHLWLHWQTPRCWSLQVRVPGMLLARWPAPSGVPPSFVGQLHIHFWTTQAAHAILAHELPGGGMQPKRSDPHELHWFRPCATLPAPVPYRARCPWPLPSLPAGWRLVLCSRPALQAHAQVLLNWKRLFHGGDAPVQKSQSPRFAQHWRPTTHPRTSRDHPPPKGTKWRVPDHQPPLRPESPRLHSLRLSTVDPPPLAAWQV